MLDRLAFLIPLVVLVALQVADFRVYIVFYLVAKMFALAYCLWNARDIISAGLYPLLDGIGLCVKSIRIGMQLTVAVVADTLILGLSRMLIDFVWGIETFGEVSFALSLINFFVAFVAQASMVLFPALRQSSVDSNRRVYVLMRDALEVFFPAVYLLYFPGVLVLTTWLPQYAESMRYLAMLLPICAFDSKMNICSATYMKVLREERRLLMVNMVTMLAGAVVSLVGAFLLNSPDAVVLGVTGCIRCPIFVFRGMARSQTQGWLKLPDGGRARRYLLLRGALAASGHSAWLCSICCPVLRVFILWEVSRAKRV